MGKWAGAQGPPEAEPSVLLFLMEIQERGFRTYIRQRMSREIANSLSQREGERSKHCFHMRYMRSGNARSRWEGKENWHVFADYRWPLFFLDPFMALFLPSDGVNVVEGVLGNDCGVVLIPGLAGSRFLPDNKLGKNGYLRDPFHGNVRLCLRLSQILSSANLVWSNLW